MPETTSLPFSVPMSQNNSMFEFLSAQEFTEYTNLDECISYLCDYMVKNGPFEGLLGFSQVKLKSNEATITEHLRIECPMFLWNLSLFSS
jgi:hypothetical protein